MYSLNYDMVVQILGQFNYSGEVHARVSSHAALKKGGRVVLMVKRGVVVSWVIFDSRGQTLYQDTEAYSILLRLGVLDWDLVPFMVSQPTTLSASPQVTPRNYTYNQSFPQCLAISSIHMHTWPTLHRSVYSLSDGTHSSEQIARLLSRPLPIIMQVLHDLVMRHAIEIKDNEDQ